MSEEQKKAEDNMEEEEEGINILDYLIILAKRKKLIITITLSVTIISLIIAILSKVSFYEAETSILPPQEDNVSMANQVMRDFGVFPARRGNIYNQRELLVEIIKSRTFTDRIIEKFRLKELYKAKDMKKARSMFLQHLTIKPDVEDTKRSNLLRGPESPLTKILFRDEDPERAATIANAIVEELKSFINNFAITEASQRRLFFEDELKQVKEALIKSEDAIKTFQEKTGLLHVEYSDNNGDRKNSIFGGPDNSKRG